MRTPISAIKTTLEVALSDPDADPQSLRTAAERVQQLNDRTTNLINSLLDLTVVDNAEIERDQLQLDAVLRHALDTVTHEAHASAINIRSTGLDAVTELLGDEMLLEQAFTNLLQNAIRHNHGGGEVTVHLDADDDYATVALENTGSVIAPEIVAQLTEPFFRGAGRAVNSDTHRGFGLGLTLVQSIVVLHGGEVSIDPRDGGGLSIVVRLPR
jgi:two-component system sensor histidine kinase VanS